MDNPTVHSILEEEAMAAAKIQAARDNAQALLKETRERIKQEEQRAREKAQAHLDACRQEAGHPDGNGYNSVYRR